MSQSLSRIYLHLIFSTKEHYPHLSDKKHREAMFGYLGATAKSKGAQPVIVGGMPDHVHILVCFPRTLTVAELIKELKRVSSLWAKEQGLSKFAWQAGYGAFSVSQSNVDTVECYIASQESHHRKMSFQEEYREFLKKHAVEYDERYVWD